MSKLSRDHKRKKEKHTNGDRSRRQYQNQTRDDDTDFMTALSAALSERIPRALDAFAAEMGCEPPQVMERIPDSSCEVSQCHANVQKKVHFHGGRAVWGWHFALSFRDYEPRLDAVFHAVWERPDGELVDVTPQSQRVLKRQRAGWSNPLPLFCEDKRYSQECEVEDLGSGLLGFREVRNFFPERQGLSTSLGIQFQT
jgi:hypothetical protein